MDELEGEILGRYTLMRRIGVGGMAKVYKGHDQESGQEYAIKLLKHEDERKDLIQRFAREMEIMRGLNHPHLVPVYDSGSGLIGRSTWYYIVMPFLSGGTLQKIIQGSPLPLDSVSRILYDIADALDYLHSKNIIHRDIKALNVLFDAEENCYLSDLGIARITDAELLHLTMTGSVMATPGYVAPELLETGRKADVKSDLYSLGVLLFEMVTGRKPFQSDNLNALLIMQIKNDPPVPGSIVPDQNLPKEVDDVILRVLAKKPEQRYNSARELADAFRDAIAVPVAPGREPGVQIDDIDPSIDADQDALEDTVDLSIDVDQDIQTAAMQESATPVQLPKSRWMTRQLEQEPVISPETSSTSAQPLPSHPAGQLEPVILSDISSAPSRPEDFTDTSPRPSMPSNSPVSLPGAAVVPDTPPANAHYTPPPPRRNVLVAILLVVVALLLIISGASVMLLARTGIASSNSNATATAGSRAEMLMQATIQAQETAATRAQATMDAQTTATARAVATMYAAPTATAGPLATATSYTPDYADSLNNANNGDTLAAGWDGAGSKDMNCLFQADGYHVVQIDTQNRHACQETAYTYGSGTITVNVRLLRGFSAGLFLRFSKDFWGSYSGYVFEFDSLGNYEFSSFAGQTLQDWTHVPYLKEGFNVKNTLAVRMSGNTFRLYANGSYLTTVTDSSNQIDSGNLAFYASSSSDVTEAVFSNLKVYSST